MNRPDLPDRLPWREIRFWPSRNGTGWDAYEHQPLAPGPMAARRRMPCVCGGSIVFVRRPHERDITNAVRTHAATAMHRRWRERWERFER
jgi:hypothetical protein